MPGPAAWSCCLVLLPGPTAYPRNKISFAWYFQYFSKEVTPFLVLNILELLHFLTVYFLRNQSGPDFIERYPPQLHCQIEPEKWKPWAKPNRAKPNKLSSFFLREERRTNTAIPSIWYTIWQKCIACLISKGTKDNFIKIKKNVSQKGRLQSWHVDVFWHLKGNVVQHFKRFSVMFCP